MRLNQIEHALSSIEAALPIEEDSRIETIERRIAAMKRTEANVFPSQRRVNAKLSREALEAVLSLLVELREGK